MGAGDFVAAGGWVTYDHTCRGIATRHCVPKDDIHEHDLSEHCACRPEESYDVADWWMHRAWDGREDYESPAPGRSPRRRKH